jgi:hypothetical protein
MPTSQVVPQLNIASRITRVRGTGLSSVIGGSGGSTGVEKSELTGPVSLAQVMAGMLQAIQSWANTLGQIVTSNIASIASIGAVSTTGKVAFGATNMTVTVNQTTNQLIFAVQYSDGTVKTGAIPLV